MSQTLLLSLPLTSALLNFPGSDGCGSHGMASAWQAFASRLV